MATLTGGEALVTALSAHGVDTVFGIPGTHNLGAFAALTSAGLRTILTRHEQGAGYAADGYARVSGRPGVCLTTTGPAILNAAASAAQAWSDSVPVLFISPGLPTGHPGLGNGYLHEVRDQRAAMAALVAYSHRVGSVAEIPLAVANAFSSMLGGRPRPVHLEIPLDLFDACGDVTLTAPVQRSLAVPPEPALDAAAAALGAAHRPVVLAGGGAKGASGQLRALAERCAAPVLTTANGKGVLDEDHPLSVGAGLHHPSARRLVENSDVVLAVGTELAPSDLWNGPYALPGTLIRIDVDASAIVTNADPAIRLLGDAGATLAALTARLPGDRPDDDRARSARDALGADAEAEGRRWRDILTALAPVVDSTTIVAGDSTMTCYYGLLSGLRVHRPAGFLYPTGAGTLGYGLPAAIGAAVAAPDARVLAVLGDGGIMFTVAELATAAQLGLALPVLVVDNGGYGEIRNEMVDRGDRPVAVDLAPVDFAALAGSMGCHGIRIDDPTALTAEVASAWQADRPTLLWISEDRTPER
ncbi:5-guanidino-2-oxopentanoate decarboxylase [Pseudonocardia spinosispora]|uniref:5-guanidino-2-oxopentanoate decarboxylase n=1 Tax=Pseudonocardia spinosispora TaxID=103441 RepID=UPI0003FE5C88|nr:5-guanidino-2-oxopentanoate decarboxylase [Pseudonocardia spinosispora]